jgi:aminopeptidase N
MNEDGYASSLPVALINGDNLTPEQIFNMFTTITYDKGVSLLFMLEDIVGAESIRSALRVSYLKKLISGIRSLFPLLYSID